MFGGDFVVVLSEFFFIWYLVGLFIFYILYCSIDDIVFGEDFVVNF